MQTHCYFKFVIGKESVDAIVSVDCTYVIVVYNFLFHFEVNDLFLLHKFYEYLYYLAPVACHWL